jgi:hypothetical protein
MRAMNEQRNKYVEVSTVELIANATAKSDVALYANHAQFSIGQNEFFIDLYLLAPSPADSVKAQATFIKRIILPFGLVKGFVSALANLIARFERDTNQAIPNNRARSSDDILDIWK